MKTAKRFLCLFLALVMLLSIIPGGILAADGDYKAWSTYDTRWNTLTLGSSTNTVQSAGSTVVAFTKLIIQSSLKNENSFTVADCVAALNAGSAFSSTGAIMWSKATKSIAGIDYDGYKTVNTLTEEAVTEMVLKNINDQGCCEVLIESTGSHFMVVDNARTISQKKIYIFDSLKATANNVNVELYSKYTPKAIYLFTVHSYTETVVAPTCTADGYTNHVCTKCGASYQDKKTAKLGHDWVGVVTPPTYTKKGYTTYTCSRCKESYTGDETECLTGHDDGWANIEGNWYYYKDNEKKTGWLKDGTAWYYMNSDGVMQTGWLQIEETWYYLKGSGAMVTGWKKLGSVWYYFKSSGAMATGWQKIGGVWYYFKSSGAMATGWQKIGGVWYYMESSGAMATGWKTLGGVTYFMKSSGAMATGWQRLDGVFYYFDASGAMVTGTREIDGTTYTFDTDGKFIG